MFCSIFIDSGSECTLIKPEFTQLLVSAEKCKVNKCNVKLNAVNNENIETLGAINLSFKFGDRIYKHEAIICEAVSYPGAILVGTDLLKRLGLISIDFSKKSVVIRNEFFPFTSIKNCHISCSVTVCKINKEEMKDKLAVTSKCETILPKTISIIDVTTPYEDGTIVLVDGNSVASNCRISNTIATVRKGKVKIGVSNFSSNTIVFPRNKLISTGWPVKPNNSDNEYIEEQPENSDLDLSHLSKNQAVIIEEILDKRRNAISQHKNDIGFCELVEHEIKTGDNKPIFTRQWPLPQSTKQTIKDQCKEMTEMGVIEKCSSPWHSPSVLVRKKDGTFRMCIDFRRINSISEKDKFPLPHIENVLESLRGAQYFSTLDLKSGYWQIGLAEHDRQKSAFSCLGETYQFRRMPFGLHNGPATFQRLMQKVLVDVLGTNAYCILDDIIIYSDSFENHVTHLDNTLSALEKAGLKIARKKCEVAKPSLKYSILLSVVKTYETAIGRPKLVAPACGNGIPVN